MHGGVGAAKKINLAAEDDFHLGALLVRPSRGRAVDARGEIRVEPRVMEVLIVLCRAQGGTVTREQLIEACWGGRTVSDDAITRVIAKLRQLASGLDAPPHFRLETLPKVGYRLSAEPSAEIERSDLPADALPVRRAPRSWRLPAAGAAFLLVLAALIFRWTAMPGNHRASGDAVRLTQAAGALIHERNRSSVAQAEHLLREAVAADPAYAPAWARLGHATWFPWWLAEQREPGAKVRVKAEALAYVDRALAIAPDLAEARGIKGMILTDTNEGMSWLIDAVRLEPDNSELWMWLGDARRGDGDLRGALAADAKAHALDPAWHYIDEPYLYSVFRLHGSAEAYRELDRIAASMNDQNWSLQMRADMEFEEGRLAVSAGLAMAALRAHPQNPYWARNRLVAVATLLGDKRLRDRILEKDPLLKVNLNALERSGWARERARQSPETWWDGTLMGAQASQLVREGSSSLLVSLYDRRFGTPEAFVRKCPWITGHMQDHATAIGPVLAVALRRVGRRAEAERLLAGISAKLRRLEQAGDFLLGTEVSRARIAALTGNRQVAMERLRDAVRRGWKGQSADFGMDPATDPAFESLRGDAAFEAIVKTFHDALRTESERLARLDLSGA